MQQREVQHTLNSPNNIQNLHLQTHVVSVEKCAILNILCVCVCVPSAIKHKRCNVYDANTKIVINCYEVLNGKE